VGAAAVSIGWPGYVTDLLKSSLGFALPRALTASPFAGGIINLPAAVIILLITGLLILGTSESSRFNNVVVAIKLIVILFFIIVGAGHINPANWPPFLPFGAGGIFQAELTNIGTLAAFVLISIAVLILRRTQPHLRRGFRVPFVPWIPILALLGALVLIVSLPLVTIIRFIIWLVVGLIIYFAYSRHKSNLQQEIVTLEGKSGEARPG